MCMKDFRENKTANELRLQRDADLRRVYFKTVESLGERSKLLTRTEVIRLTLRNGAPRTYINPEQAEKIWYTHKRKKPFTRKSPIAQRRANHIIRLMKPLITEQHLTVKEASFQAVYAPAPSFFVSVDSAIKNILTGAYDARRIALQEQREKETQNALPTARDNAPARKSKSSATPFSRD